MQQLLLTAARQLPATACLSKQQQQEQQRQPQQHHSSSSSSTDNASSAVHLLTWRACLLEVTQLFELYVRLVQDWQSSLLPAFGGRRLRATLQGR